MAGLLSLEELHLPLGFRFRPSDVEIIDHYLRLKINGKDDQVSCISEIDLCSFEPWDLPGLSAIKIDDSEWFFFCPWHGRNINGRRSNRSTRLGYWKATGRDRNIKSRKKDLIGKKKSLVFYRGRAPKGERTSWVIHEYHPILQELDGTNPGQAAFVLCRLFKKADDLKQHENDDGSNNNERGPICSSFTKPNISQEDVFSECPDSRDLSTLDNEAVGNVDNLQPKSIAEILASIPDLDDFSIFDELGDIHGSLAEIDVSKNTEQVAWEKPLIYENGSSNGADIGKFQFQFNCVSSGRITPRSNEPKFSDEVLKNHTYTDDDDDAILCNLSSVQVTPKKVPIEALGRKQITYNLEPWGPQPILLELGTASRQKQLNSLYGSIKTCTTGSSSSADVVSEDFTCLDGLLDEAPLQVEDDKSRMNVEHAEFGNKTSTDLWKTSSFFCSRPRRIHPKKFSLENYNAEEEQDDEETPLVSDEKSCADLSDQKPSLCKKSISVSPKGTECRPSLYLRGIVVLVVAFFFMACIGLWKSKNAALSLS